MSFIDHAADAIQLLVQKLVDSSKQRSRELVTHRKRHKRETKLTQEVKKQTRV